MTQNQKILSHLKSHTGITSITAFEKYGITRLSGRIFDLREMGYKISTNMKTAKNRYGDTCHVAEYRLIRG